MTAVHAGETWLQVLMLTVIIGGGAAVLAGRAIAGTWRPYWHVPCYMLLLGGGVHFLHFALFSGDILSLPSYLVDTAYLVAASSIAFRATRSGQLARQYPWLYERTGPFTWRNRNSNAEKSTQNG
jgi:hypothetical protein